MFCLYAVRLVFLLAWSFFVKNENFVWKILVISTECLEKSGYFKIKNKTGKTEIFGQKSGIFKVKGKENEQTLQLGDNYI